MAIQAADAATADTPPDANFLTTAADELATVVCDDPVAAKA